MAVGLQVWYRFAKAPASWRTPNASRLGRHRSESRQRRQSGGLLLLCESSPVPAHPRTGRAVTPCHRGKQLRPSMPLAGRKNLGQGLSGSWEGNGVGYSSDGHRLFTQPTVRLPCRPAPEVSETAACVAIWAGMGRGFPTELCQVARNSGRFWGAGWGSRSPGAVSFLDSASKQAHSNRFATSEAPFEIAAAEKFRRLSPATGHRPGWNPALQNHGTADKSDPNRPCLPMEGGLPRRPALGGAFQRVGRRDAFHSVPWPG